MIESLLIANRGEIACRVIRTARRMGVRTIAVYSDADARALHVRAADAAVHIGPSPARDSYLAGDRIIAAALESGAQAIHPGYGFLSENAAFAQAVIDAGLVWVGPDPASITAMGLKDAAKALMARAGVPVTPGYLGEDQSGERLRAEADAIGYPMLIKAVAGGGGKGMRKVDAAADFDAALASCRREAAASFGNDAVLLEQWIGNPRHIEVQIFGDRHGNIVHLFERDCSLQRRHQKVIEEAPAPGMDEATRAAVCRAAVDAGKAVGYVGAGTVEFIADGSQGLRADRIWFMEMNTRLQVEHPVTEEITGQDLVEWQLRVAAGEALPCRQEDLSIRGWALEARLYAEDPAKGFLPSTGRLDYFVPPHLGHGRRCRIETGVEQGDVISPYYDPMIAKLVTHGDSRDAAIAHLKAMTARTRCWPVKTNAGFLNRLLKDADFAAGRMDTGLIGARMDAFLPDEKASGRVLQSVAHMVMDHAAGGRARTIRDTGLDSDPARTALRGFRLNHDPAPAIMRLSDGAQDYEVTFEDRSIDDCLWVESIAQGWAVTEDGVTRVFTTARADGGGGADASDGTILSPMPGRVIAVAVAVGQAVTKGQVLLTLEAMKMEHSLVAPFDGVIAQLDASDGGQVREGALLAKIDRVE